MIYSIYCKSGGFSRSGTLNDSAEPIFFLHYIDTIWQFFADPVFVGFQKFCRFVNNTKQKIMTIFLHVLEEEPFYLETHF